MTAPVHSASSDEWLAWINDVAPYRGPTAADQPIEIRQLAAIPDREIAALAAKGIVAELRKRGSRV